MGQVFELAFFSKDEVKMANQHVEICSTSLDMVETQVEIMRIHSIRPEMAEIRKITGVGEGVGKLDRHILMVGL